MLGWEITVYRQVDSGSKPAMAKSPQGNCLARWRTRSEGLDWIKALVKEGRAIDLGGDGYPSFYTATAGQLIPRVLNGPAGALTSLAPGMNPEIDRVLAEDCRPDEWLIVEVWDQS